MESDESFASWLRELRRRLGLTRGALGRRVGAGKGAVGDWERGRTVPGAAIPERLTELAEGAGLGPLPEGAAARAALAQLYERRRPLAAAKKAALAEVRAVRVRHRPSTGTSTNTGATASKREAFAAALAADQARLAAELDPLEARLAEIGRELEGIDAAVSDLRRGRG